MLLTSGYGFEGYEIVSYIGHESAQVVLDTEIFSEIDEFVSDFLGGRSNSYEDKLDSAEKSAKLRLIEKAKRSGGNAIIGIDIDYTTFTNDVIGVIAGGTIVKIERKMPEKEVKRISNMEYNTSIPLRILDSVLIHKLDQNEIYVSLIGKNYSKSEIKGLEVKVSVETIFGDTLEIPNVMFADIYMDEENEISTEYTGLKMESNVFRIIKSVSVQITKYITCRNGVIEVPENGSQTIDITHEQLNYIRNLYGHDAVNKAYRSESGWICFCGTENKNEEQVCKCCGREIQLENLRSVSHKEEAGVFDLNKHMDIINTFESAKEIYEYLEDLNNSDIYFGSIVLPELRKLVRYENMYGLMKESAVEKLIELYDKE